MDAHQRLGTLAEKLEFSNALLKQAQRDLKKERVEHGKTQALVDELEHKLRTTQRESIVQTPKASATPALTSEERMRIRRDEMVESLRRNNAKLMKMCKNLRTTNKKLIADLCRLERERGDGNL